jgi:hypothetical protein
MCFSAEASFAVGGILVPTGVYCVQTVWTKNPRLIPIALIPLAFAVQQIAEGFVWTGLRHQDAALARSASLVFLFFALAFWPFWFAFLNAILETRPGRKRLFIGLSVLTSAWFWILFYPLLVNPEILSIESVHHSLQYRYSELPVRQYIPRPALIALYILSIAVPMMLGQNVFGKFPLVFFLGSAVVAAVVFHYAFISVWCFFAAVLTTYLCVVFYRVPAGQPEVRSVELCASPK